MSAGAPSARPLAVVPSVREPPRNAASNSARPVAVHPGLYPAEYDDVPCRAGPGEEAPITSSHLVKASSRVDHFILDKPSAPPALVPARDTGSSSAIA